MENCAMPGSLSRRELLQAGIVAPLGLATAGQQSAALGPPPYTISINIEIMFRATKYTRADRIRAVAANGFKAYSFWSADEADRKEMLKAQKETGITCVSLVGTGQAGGTTGFTRPGAADALLKEFAERVAIAQDFGTPDLISFVGQIQNDVPWDVQRAGIIDGLKRAGDIAAKGGVTITLEPLSVGANQPRRALDRCLEAFPAIKEVNHPNVKICFDLYHLQRTEGNLTVNLRTGWEQGLIKIVQIGDVPGRNEPGTGEINYPFIFKELRRIKYNGYLDTEMGTSSTYEHAMQVTRRLSEEN
jgi:hydroxypyruvate isomerase